MQPPEKAPAICHWGLMMEEKGPDVGPSFHRDPYASQGSNALMVALMGYNGHVNAGETTGADNDSTHTSRLCKGYLTKKESDGLLRQMIWPPQSPDLNPIEMVRVPGLVKNLTVDNITTTSVSLNWQKPDGNADSYMIQVLEYPSFNRIVNTTLNTIGGLTPGYYYTFMVFALVGNNSVQGKKNTTYTYTEPEIVGNLRKLNATTTSVSLSWEKPIGNSSSYPN
ncbi:unnamed protein product [Ranitomeya imitator]|uniref:Fibronectin type-III domain-containing protein n=1 Tax=Ranitomeya imitator TaxID=111125 RepID=A0ABN9LII5_9NEOB|nr:unnamed protein product [Ranitomeya imitator]